VKKEAPTQQEQQRPLPDLELELPPSPPPVEDLIAARRAKRQAILAKYADREGSTASASSIIRNSVELPPESPIAKSTASQVKDIPDSITSDIPVGTESKHPFSLPCHTFDHGG
jgi:serine/threonine-protein kinase PRP4